jgi:hypothetical protein
LQALKKHVAILVKAFFLSKAVCKGISVVIVVEKHIYSFLPLNRPVIACQVIVDAFDYPMLFVLQILKQAWPGSAFATV